MALVNHSADALGAEARFRYVALALGVSGALLAGVALGWVASTIVAANATQVSAAGVDPLAQPNLIQFRASEHAEAVTAAGVDPLAQPNLIQFRASEHAEAVTAAGVDPLAQPNLIQFRASEHGEAP